MTMADCQATPSRHLNQELGGQGPGLAAAGSVYVAFVTDARGGVTQAKKGLRQTRGACGCSRFCKGIFGRRNGVAVQSVVCQASGRGLSATGPVCSSKNRGHIGSIQRAWLEPRDWFALFRTLKSLPHISSVDLARACGPQALPVACQSEPPSTPFFNSAPSSSWPR